MTDKPTNTPHFCPGCGAALKHFARYPWHFCNDCRETACDREGRKLSFGNASMSGGLSWRYVDDASQRDDLALAVICVINKRPALVHEARFGGVVAEPIPDNPRWWHKDPDRVANLWSRGHIKKAQKRLKPV